jgi:hypothetical protein
MARAPAETGQGLEETELGVDDRVGHVLRATLSALKILPASRILTPDEALDQALR